jgi:hypothetical protein
MHDPINRAKRVFVLIGVFRKVEGRIVVVKDLFVFIKTYGKIFPVRPIFALLQSGQISL